MEMEKNRKKEILIEQGQLKFGYFTIFVRLGTDLSPFLMRDPKIVILLQRKAVA